jgi:hypothetical protein
MKSNETHWKQWISRFWDEDSSNRSNRHNPTKTVRRRKFPQDSHVKNLAIGRPRRAANLLAATIGLLRSLDYGSLSSSWQTHRVTAAA